MFSHLTSSHWSAAAAAIGLAIFFYGASVVSFAEETEPTSGSLPDWIRMIDAHQDRLMRVDSDQEARRVFVEAIGRAAGLHDVAGTLAVQGISSKLAQQLMVPEITMSAQRLVAALAVWRLADRMMQSSEGKTDAPDSVLPASQAGWLAANGSFPSLNEAMKHWHAQDRSAAASVAAAHLTLEAHRQAMEEWWRLKTWKDRVRSMRGMTRLCGTWQWVIHNHQRHHEEQRLSLVFPPPGKDGALFPGLSEVIVLGDVVYLRWEGDGKVQEDSLLFSKEGQRLEGTFVNSQGGWGSVSGKRTAACTP